MSISQWNKMDDILKALTQRIAALEDVIAKQPEPAEAVTELVRRRGRPPKTEETHDIA